MAGADLLLKFAVVGFKSKGFGRLGDEDPRSIMRDAADPNVDPAEVLARARIRSRSGSLVKAAAEAISRRTAY